MVIKEYRNRKTIKKLMGTMVLVGIIMTLFSHMIYAKMLQYSPSKSIDIEWGWDLFKNKADVKNSLNSNLAKGGCIFMQRNIWRIFRY